MKPWNKLDIAELTKGAQDFEQRVKRLVTNPKT
jgi:hypothetical protein